MNKKMLMLKANVSILEKQIKEEYDAVENLYEGYPQKGVDYSKVWIRYNSLCNLKRNYLTRIEDYKKTYNGKL
jgi:autonomous glycyl radical cofactor GrcA